MATSRVCPRAWASAEQLEEGRLAGGVEPDEGLVDQQHVEGADEGHGDGGLLAQASAEAGGEVVGPVVEAEVVRGGRRRAAPSRRGRAGGRRTRGAPTPTGPRRTSGCRRGSASGARAGSDPAGWPSTRMRAVARLQQAGRHAQERRLARAVVADEHDGLAVVDVQVELGQRGAVAVDLRQPDRAHRTGRPLSGWPSWPASVTRPSSGGLLRGRGVRVVRSSRWAGAPGRGAGDEPARLGVAGGGSSPGPPCRPLGRLFLAFSQHGPPPRFRRLAVADPGGRHDRRGWRRRSHPAAPRWQRDRPREAAPRAPSTGSVPRQHTTTGQTVRNIEPHARDLRREQLVRVGSGGLGLLADHADDRAGARGPHGGQGDDGDHARAPSTVRFRA